MAPLFKCLEACFELFVPLVVADMIDVGITRGDVSYILSRGCLLLLLAAVGLICSITAQYFAATAAAGIGRSISDNLFSHIMKLGYKEIDEIGTAKLLTRISSDVTRVQTGINMFLRLFMRSPFIVFGSVIMAFTVDPGSGPIFIILVAVLMVIVFGILFGTMPYYNKVQLSLDRVTLLTRETLSGQRVIRAFNRQENEKEEFLSENGRLVSFQLFAGKISALMNPLTLAAVNIGIVCLLYTGAIRVNIGDLTQGETIALVNYMNQILVELIKLANLIIQISRALTSMKRINEILDIKNSMDVNGSEASGSHEGSCSANGASASVSDTAFGAASAACDMTSDTGSDTSAAPPVIEFRNVSFGYGSGKNRVLSDISFEAQRGDSIGIIGGTGSGKSTLVNLIPRFYDVSEGSILLDGKDIRKDDISGLRSRIGIVPQKAGLFAMSLRDNLRLGAPEADDEALLRAMEDAQAAELLTIKKDGLDHQIEQDGRNLSGGQRQRVTIARALARDPEILILDDAASALDFATDSRLRKSLRKYSGRMTVFIVSQRVSAVRDCDKIIVLSNGHMAGIGTHKELLLGCPEYREICETQMTKEEVERDENA